MLVNVINQKVVVNGSCGITSNAEYSPASQGIQDINIRIAIIKEYEQNMIPRIIDFKKIIGTKEWENYWNEYEEIKLKMKEVTITADKIKEIIRNAT